jgi:hypothetical protein
MSNTVRFQIEQKEIDSSSNESDDKSYTFVIPFTDYCKNEFTLTSALGYVVINFGKVTTSSAIMITTDATLTIKLNNGTEQFSITKGAVLTGAYTALAIQNNSGSTATIKIEVYGV